jgi:hypothetical protein
MSSAQAPGRLFPNLERFSPVTGEVASLSEPERALSRSRSRLICKPLYIYRFGARAATTSAEVTTGITSKRTMSSHAAIHWSRSDRSSHSITW